MGVRHADGMAEYGLPVLAHALLFSFTGRFGIRFDILIPIEIERVFSITKHTKTYKKRGFFQSPHTPLANYLC
jgi:hypothetical protein